ncbi:hydroxypyruvate isomerase [Noviherbaspirillum galbum]|uniref:Hydroxypyruvate isomerase n=1 Tax=Noviherbaspirillum galbum TaxID=2709383 RepID=A0A6B3STR2_9BURK|nr:hydroxypyruvate isomerase [Noviherbaspirillum galbum]NEX64390.1 hydroxypyruvate isomerase [Noviherbaspirillum galbum]
MSRLAANLTMLFNEHAFLDRFEAAARAGFRGVEFLFPYAFPAQRIADRLAACQLELVLHNLPAGKWEEGERGIACHPDRVGEFRDGVGEAIRYARALGTRQINCLAGITPPGTDPDAVRRTLVDNLRFAADKLGEQGIRLLVEPVNDFDIPGFYLTRTRQAIDLIRDTGSANIYLQYDIYHMQRMEGELAGTIRENLDIIRHIQLADNPGRFEPGTGEINYRALFVLLDELNYDGWIGCEYKPRAGTLEGLGWRQAHGLAA